MPTLCSEESKTRYNTFIGVASIKRPINSMQRSRYGKNNKWMGAHIILSNTKCTNNSFSILIILCLWPVAHTRSFTASSGYQFWAVFSSSGWCCECAIHSADSIQQPKTKETQTERNQSVGGFRVQRKPAISIATAFIPLLKIPSTISFISTKRKTQTTTTTTTKNRIQMCE